MKPSTQAPKGKPWASLCPPPRRATRQTSATSHLCDFQDRTECAGQFLCDMAGTLIVGNAPRSESQGATRRQTATDPNTQPRTVAPPPRWTTNQRRHECHVLYPQNRTTVEFPEPSRLPCLHARDSRMNTAEYCAQWRPDNQHLVLAARGRVRDAMQGQPMGRRTSGRGEDLGKGGLAVQELLDHLNVATSSSMVQRRHPRRV